MGQSDQKHVVVIAMYNVFFLLSECLLYKAVCQRDRGQIVEAHFILLKLNSDLIETHRSGTTVLPIRHLILPPYKIIKNSHQFQGSRAGLNFKISAEQLIGEWRHG